MLLSHVYFGFELAHDVYVTFCNAACERGDEGVLSVAIDDTSVDFLHECLRIGYALTYLVYDGFVAFAVRVRHIVAQSDVTPLYGCVQLGKLSDNLVVKVIDAAVVLPQLLDALGWDKTAANQVLQHAFRYPLSILHVTLVTGKLLDEIRVDELQLDLKCGSRHRHIGIQYALALSIPTS